MDTPVPTDHRPRRGKQNDSAPRKRRQTAQNSLQAYHSRCQTSHIRYISLTYLAQSIANTTPYIEQ